MFYRQKPAAPPQEPINVWSVRGVTPEVHKTAYVHPSAVLMGDVQVGENCYIGPSAVLRGDNGSIRIHQGANLQDGCVIHGAPGVDTIIEQDGHIGHGAILHGCRVGINAFVGMNSVCMDHSVVEEDAWVAAMCFVKENQVIPKGMLAGGTPAKILRALTEEQLASKKRSTAGYHRLVKHSAHDIRPAIATRSMQDAPAAVIIKLADSQRGRLLPHLGWLGRVISKSK